jgi:integrase
MAKAGHFAMNREAANGAASFSTAATVGDRFNRFAELAKADGLRRLEEVTRDQVMAYGQTLADQVAEGALSAAYAQNLVSAVNTVMNAATRGQWQSVSPTRECGIAQRSSVRDTPAASIDRSRVEAAQAAMNDRGQAITDLARDLGLRSKEASLINVRGALSEARDTGRVTIVDGTKGGRARQVPITQERQIASLERAALVQGEARSLIPESQTWAQFRDGELREIRETLQDQGLTGLHDLRAGYASERYQALTGERPPLEGGQVSKADDKAARQILAVELGHGRIDVIASYIGGRP